MAKGKPCNGVRKPRRTRQQMLLEAEAAIMKRAPTSSSPVQVDDPSLLAMQHDAPIPQPSAGPGSASSTCSANGVTATGNGNTKKSLRILFQDAKNGKLAESKQRMNFKYPRTVEAANCPFDDPTGKNKMFFLIAIDLYPDSKIVQPSDAESESEESVSKSDMELGNNGVDSMEVYDNYTASSHDILAASPRAELPDDAFFIARTPSPTSPKVKRGRRPNNARRIPYGRAADIDHSWRSNYNRRNVRRPVRNRIKDPQVIQDVINTVIQRYTQCNVSAPVLPPSPPEGGDRNHNYCDAVSNSSDDDNDANNNTYARKLFDDDNEENSARAQTPMRELIAENLAFIKQEIRTPEPSSEEEEDDELMPFSQQNGTDVNVGASIPPSESELYISKMYPVEQEDEDDDDEDRLIIAE